MAKMKKISPVLHAAGAADMQCFSHFRRQHLRSPSALSVRSVEYDAIYPENFKTAARRFTFAIARQAGTRPGPASFMAPTAAAHVKNVAAWVDGQAAEVTLKRRGKRTEMVVDMEHAEKNAAVSTLELTFDTPAMILGQDENQVFIGDFFVLDAPVARWKATVRLPPKWQASGSLPNGTARGSRIATSGPALRACEHQLLCFSAHRTN
jgi:hypothetical protein